MTASEILAGFAAIGARVVLTPAGVVDVDAPAVPELGRLVAAVKANRAEVVEELRRAAVLALPGREPERPCLACGRECPEGVLFHSEACFQAWKAHRRPRVTRSETSPARAIPREDGAA